MGHPHSAHTFGWVWAAPLGPLTVGPTCAQYFCISIFPNIAGIGKFLPAVTPHRPQNDIFIVWFLHLKTLETFAMKSRSEEWVKRLYYFYTQRPTTDFTCLSESFTIKHCECKHLKNSWLKLGVAKMQVIQFILKKGLPFGHRRLRKENWGTVRHLKSRILEEWQD